MYYGSFIEEVQQLKQHTNGLYIYGAGYIGKDVCHILSRNGIEIGGFILTNPENSKDAIGYKIYKAQDLIHENVGIILGLGDVYTKEVKEYLDKHGVPQNRVVDGGKYLLQNKQTQRNLQSTPVLEITTVIGCSICCKYCPQELLIRNYFLNHKNRPRVLSVETFAKLLNNTPKNCKIMFAGMSEPFLNDNFPQMLQIAFDAGRDVLLYTTMEGASSQIIEKLVNFPFFYVCLHVADGKGHASITLNEEYYHNLERLMESYKPDGTPFIDSISAQAEPPKRIMDMCKGRYEVLISLQDRAGNLNDKDLARREKELTNEKIHSCCITGPNFDTHVALPDGTLLLCDSDYGMQHVLGNLAENTWEELRNGEEMKRIRRGLSGDAAIDILCKKCLMAMTRK